MPNKNKEKGDALEEAVKLIQDAILSADSKMAGTKFSIETNKIVTVAGVRHEIDVYVKTLPGSPYESTYLFECKNWKQPVGKNEVIVLSEKVRALGATRGFFVARELTRDAEAQVKLDPRLLAVPCRDDFVSPLSFNLIHIIHEPISIQATLKERGVPPLERPPVLDWKTTVWLLNRIPIDICAYAHQHVAKMAEHDKKENAAMYRTESCHHRQSSVLVRFALDEFLVDGRDMEEMTITVTFWIEVHKQKLISKFELKDQGRAYFFEPIKYAESGKQVEISIVQRI